MMFNEDIRSKKSLQHKKYTINRCTFILMFFMINLTIDLYYYYEYVNMYLVCTYNMARYYFHIVILSVFLYKTVCIFFTKQHIFIYPIQLQFRFPPNLFLAIVNTHEMCHAKYSTWLYIYIFLININVNKRETLIKQIGYSQVSYKIYRKKYLPVGKTSQILPLSELFVFTITAFKIFSSFIMFVLMLHYEPSLWKEYYPHVKYNPVCIESHKCTFKGRIVCIKYRSRPVHEMLKNILGYIHGKVRMLFTGIEICKNDIKCCIFVILCRYCRLIMFFFYLTTLELLYIKKKNIIVCKYGILMTLLWLKKNRIVTYQIQILSHKKCLSKI